MSAISVVKKFFPQVTKVVDAKTNALIEVTPKDVSSKAVRNHNACAMAVACKRKFHLDGVIISRSVAYLIKGKQARRFKVPVTVAREVVSFDRGAGFMPGKYSLQAPSPQSRMGARAKRTDLKDNRAHNNKGVLEKRFRHLTENVRDVLGGEVPKES